jgi:hypothetical protein
MNLTQLPPEVQFNYLLQLSPPEILNFCRVNKQAESICNNVYFWNEKAKRDFGYSMDLLCQMHPYWQYQFAGSLLTSDAIIPPLVRAGQTQVVEDLLTDPTVSLQYFRDYIQSLEVVYYINDPFYRWLTAALFNIHFY